MGSNNRRLAKADDDDEREGRATFGYILNTNGEEGKAMFTRFREERRHVRARDKLKVAFLLAQSDSCGRFTTTEHIYNHPKKAA